MPIKRKNVQDATLKNIRAIRKQIASLETRLATVEETLLRLTVPEATVEPLSSPDATGQP